MTMSRSIAAALLALFAAGNGLAQNPDSLVLAARDALRVNDGARLATLRFETQRLQHPLASWVDYWEIGARLNEVQQPEIDAFYARWPGSYVEDRLRNDWLLVLGKRRDWDNFRREYPRFRMDDDREVRCYALLTRSLDGQDVTAAALDAWAAQRRDDDGCRLLLRSLAEAGRLKPADLWRMVRSAVETGRDRAAVAAAALIGPPAERTVRELLDQPERYLAGQQRIATLAAQADPLLLALLRLAARDSDAAAAQLQAWESRLPPAHAAAAWAAVARQSAQRLQPQAADHVARAWSLLPPAETRPDWPAETLAWAVRASLRGGPPAARWAQVERTIDAMAPAEQADPTWVYWKGRAVQARAAAGDAGAAERERGRLLLQSIAGPHHFYGLLALEDLGGRFTLPAAASAPTETERAAVRAQPGLQRALQLIALGLRNEGVREWNYTLRDLNGDRALLAAAQWACEREVWDRCINTSDRTRSEIDSAQRYPMPFKAQVVAQARDIGLDPAYVYGLIRQESRFIADARSGVGASGLMQLMPATARWTANKAGIDFKPEMINDRATNLRLGTRYLKLVLDDFEGAQALAAAAYNAGPGRPRRWREGPVLEPAAWIENIPFAETRDYVKKVLANAVHYGALLGEPEPSVKRRLGTAVGPRAPSAPQTSRELP